MIYRISCHVELELHQFFFSFLINVIEVKYSSSMVDCFGNEATITTARLHDVRSSTVRLPV